MKNRTQDYNLLTENWIPVLWSNGHTGRIGITEALTQAGRIRQIAASNPMDRLAIFRFLLALLYWCRGNPPVGAEAFPDDSFPSSWFNKLEENSHRFNLLGGGKRFYQYKLPEFSTEKLLSAEGSRHRTAITDKTILPRRIGRSYVAAADEGSRFSQPCHLASSRVWIYPAIVGSVMGDFAGRGMPRVQCLRRFFSFDGFSQDFVD